LKQWIKYGKEGKDEYCTCKKNVWNFDMDELEKACKGETHGDIVKFVN
jgi:hypothetical protein